MDVRPLRDVDAETPADAEAPADVEPPADAGAPGEDAIAVLHDECWLPFGVEMQELDAYDALADDLDAVREANVAYRRERHENEDAHTVVAVPAEGERRPPELADALADPTVSDAGTVDTATLDDPATFAGYAASVRSETPPVFARGDHLTVEEVYVRPEYRGKGLAIDLLEAVEAWGREHGCERAELHVNARNETARAVYERHGYDVFMHKCRHEL